jgi:uncharacterized damage-inducible protein DinB
LIDETEYFERQTAATRGLASVMKTTNLKAGRQTRMSVDMSDSQDQPLLEALLDSWDRNNTILVNLLRALPEGGLDVKPMDSSPSIAQLFTHIHYVRLIFITEDAPEFSPEFGKDLPETEWLAEHDPARIAQMLNESAAAVCAALKGRLEAGRPMNLHYDHPILFLQHMLWHEGYHHGQIKLALKLAGRPITDDEAGPLTWGVWMRKK